MPVSACMMSIKSNIFVNGVDWQDYILDNRHASCIGTGMQFQ